MINYREAADKFLDDAANFIGKEFTNELDVEKIIESIYKMDSHQLLEDIAFTSKFSVGLVSILNNSSTEVSDEYKANIQNDFEDAVKKLKELFSNSISNFTEAEKASFESRYFALTQSSFSKFMSLVEDFSKIKLYLNSVKQKS
ncbi:MAG: hypothetical protein KKH32_00840 [Bacteroidetes bacterium]|nr:hypothetical protein [Bacteroidota bacterium]